MITVYFIHAGFSEIYECVEDFLNDYVTDEMVIGWLNEYFPPVEIPILGNYDAGDLIYNACNGIGAPVRWEDIVDDFIMNEVERIEDELAERGQTEYHTFLIIDPNFHEG